MPPLFSPAETDLLDALDYREDTVLAESSRLRAQGLEPERVSALLTQARLRREARAKFGEEAAGLLFTRPGLEQATRRAVASWHALRFREAGVVSVADLGCGIGADSRAFARAGMRVLAVEIDPDTAEAARHNLAAFPEARVHTGDVAGLGLESWGRRAEEGGGADVDVAQNLTVAGESVQALWLDPARREQEGGGSRRIFDPEAFSPPFSLIRRLARAGIPLGVKMGPGMDHADIPPEAEAEWISHGGEVVELVLWFNALARPGVRRAATVLGADPHEPRVLAQRCSAEDFGASPTPPTGAPGRFLHEPDGAVIRAGLVDQLVGAVDGWLLDPRIAYVCSDCPHELAWATGWRIVAELPLQEKAMKHWVREHGITALTIKKRGVDVVPETLRRRLLSGSGKGGKKRGSGNAATLVLTRWDAPGGQRRACFVVEPLPESAPTA